MIVIVEPGERAVIERLGQVHGEDLGPGLHVKLPWPIDQAQIVTGDIQEVVLGAHSEDGHAPDEGPVVLWTTEHEEEGNEYDILVAPPYYEKTRASCDPRSRRSSPEESSRAEA